MLNIPSHIEDPNYRYKMPAIQIQGESRGNGVKTKLVNLSDVSKCLNVPTEYPLRFFAAELGASAEYKQSENKAILKGTFRREDLQKLLDQFIEKFVLCPRCHLPEITYRLKRKELISDCKACGNVKPMDMTHKISNFILKHPPKAEEKPAEKPDKKALGKKKVVKKEKKDKEPDEIMNLDHPDVLEAIERASIHKDETPEKIVEHINNVCIANGIEPDLRVYVTLKAIFSENLINLLKDQGKLYVLKSQTDGYPEELLMCLAVVYIPDESYHSRVSRIMMTLYENDIFSEDFLLSWATDEAVFNESSVLYNPSQLSTFKQCANDFLTWIQNAESEDESESEEEAKEESPELTQQQIIQKQLQDQEEKLKAEADRLLKELKDKDRLEKEQLEIEAKAGVDLMAKLQVEEDFNIDDI